MNYTPTQAKHELDGINAKLKSYNSLLERKRQLETFLSLAEQLAHKPRNKSRATVVPVRMRPKISTAEAAELVLKAKPNTHLKELHRLMREIGWVGSGNVLNEKKAIYVAMLRQPQRFEKVGANVWALRQQTKAAS